MLRLQSLVSSIHLRLMRLRGKDITRKGTWYSMSEIDPRWNGQASQLGDMFALDTHSQQQKYKAQKTALYGQPPEDLLWRWCREK